MKKTLFVVLALAIAAPLFAHPASDISMKYDHDKKTLEITVLHKVRDSQKHFIDDIEVSLNDTRIVTQKFMTQTDNVVQQVRYVVIDAQPGDTIKIDSECNLSGSLEQKFIIPEKK